MYLTMFQFSDRLVLMPLLRLFLLNLRWVLGNLKENVLIGVSMVNSELISAINIVYLVDMN